MALKEVAILKAEDPESDKNLYFKTMTSKEINERATTLEARLADYRKAIKSGEDAAGH